MLAVFIQKQPSIHTRGRGRARARLKHQRNNIDIIVHQRSKKDSPCTYIVLCSCLYVCKQPHMSYNSTIRWDTMLVKYRCVVGGGAGGVTTTTTISVHKVDLGARGRECGHSAVLHRCTSIPPNICQYLLGSERPNTIFAGQRTSKHNVCWAANIQTQYFEVFAGQRTSKYNITTPTWL